MPVRIDAGRSFHDFLARLEDGSMLHRVGWVIFLLGAVITAATSLNYSTAERTVIDLTTGREQYHARRVSEIPRELEKDEAQKQAVDDDQLGVEDIRQRYVSYIVSRIERNKLYPEESQRKGHEGVVVVRLLLARNGSVRKVTILQPARYPALTDAAIASIARSVPFEPFPKNLVEEEMTVRLEIRFTLR
ncbi:MAG: energy transducer TonB [Spirochaetes bacterium]|jgi:TonB family protein|nr:energy transducer TonB [Spirochaetota bacterium]